MNTETDPGSREPSNHRRPSNRQKKAPIFTAVLALLTLALLGSVAASSVPLDEDEHSHSTAHSPITTESPEAQRLFDQGLAQAYGFNHAEAAETFRRAIQADPECAMCHWGLGLVLGPNINFPMVEDNHAEAVAATRRALELSRGVSERERAYIEALQQRYDDSWTEDRAELDQAYAKAMRRVARRFPDDLHAGTLFAEALMDTTAWDYWLDNGEPKDVTREFIGELESVLKRQPDHPGAAHYLIHAVELARPELAEPAADRLAASDQATGHLIHMAGHIYIRVGRYHDASRVNQAAIEKDRAYMKEKHAEGDYTMFLAPHNVHFLWASSTLEGRSELATKTARELRSGVDTALMRQPGMETLQHFWITPLYAAVRFGRWDEILETPKPDADLLYPIGAWHYARGTALLRKGESEEARVELESLESFASDPRLDDITVFGLNSTRTLLQIGAGVLGGELAAQEGDFDTATRRLERAVELQDNLTYDEPPPWHFPVRQALAAVLLDAGRAGEAERVYREDLEEFPYNGWSLHGLARSLEAQGKKSELAKVEKQFEKAWQHADVELTRSVF